MYYTKSTWTDSEINSGWRKDKISELQPVMLNLFQHLTSVALQIPHWLDPEINSGWRKDKISEFQPVMLNLFQHDWNIVITEIRWIKLRVTREVIYNSDIPYLIQNLSILILSYLITYLPIHFSKEILRLRLWITLLC